MIPPTVHFIVLVHDVIEKGLVRVLVNHYLYHVRKGVWVNVVCEGLSESINLVSLSVNQGGIT
jgi:hypothetical protein